MSTFPRPGASGRARRRHPRGPKLDRLARSVPAARDIGDASGTRGVQLSLGGSIYDPVTRS
jgi:hypothetical protein